MIPRHARWLLCGVLFSGLVGGVPQPIATSAQALSPSVLGQVGGAAYDVVVQGDRAYLVVDRRLLVLDVSDPANISRLGQTDLLQSQLGNVALSGSYALVLGQSDEYTPAADVGLHVIDVADSAAPRELAYLDVAGTLLSLAVSGGYAYVASNGTGMVVIDLQRPEAPRIVATLPPTDNGNFLPTFDVPIEVAVDGRYALLVEEAGARETDGLVLVIDVADPRSPRIVGSLATGLTEEVVLHGTTAYIAEENGLSIVSIADPTVPKRLGAVGLGAIHPTLGRDGTRMALAGTRLYIVGDGRQFWVLDVADSTQPRVLGSATTEGLPAGVAASGSFAFVANGDDNPLWPVFHGLQVIRVEDPASPQTYGNYSRDTWVAMDVAWEPGRPVAYVAAGGAGLRVIDLSDPTAPTILAAIEWGASATTVTLDGEHLFVGEGASDNRLQIFDVKDPAQPVRIATLSEPPGLVAGEPGGSVSALDNVGSWVFAGLTDGRLVVVDASEPTAPRVVTVLPLSSDLRMIGDIVVEGGYLFVREPGDQSSGGSPSIVHVLSITDPALIRPVAEIAAPPSFGSYDIGLGVDNGWAYAPDSTAVEIIDLRNPSQPGGRLSLHLGHYAEVWSLGAHQGAVVVSDGRGVTVIDAIDVQRARVMGSILWPSRWSPFVNQGVVVGDGTALVAHRNAGLLTVGFVPPVRPTATDEPTPTSRATETPTATDTAAPAETATSTAAASPTVLDTPTWTATTTTSPPDTATPTTTPTASVTRTAPATPTPSATDSSSSIELYLPRLFVEPRRR